MDEPASWQPEPVRSSQLAHLIDLLDAQVPAEAFRRLVQARMETLARLGDEAPKHGASLDDLQAALRVGLEAIEEARR